METTSFLDIAVKNLPGGLILLDLDSTIHAINKTAETLLGVSATVTGSDCEKALSAHPKLAKILKDTCHTLKPFNRQELVTQKPNGDKMVLGYSTLILKNDKNDPIGVGLTFQDITRFIPLMDAHNFLDVTLKNLPGGLIFIDLQGKVRGVNQSAQRLLDLPAEGIESGTACHDAFAKHPQVVKVLLSTSQSLNTVNRQEITTRNPNGEKVTLGYGTLVIKNQEGKPIGVGMTFQDITRFIPLPLQIEFIRLVDRFFTPFALVMVVASMFLGFAEPWAIHISLAITIALFGVNEGSVYLVRRRPEFSKVIGNTRLATNFLSNVALVYLLGTFWGPMWLLFVLTPVATGLYADWKRTFWTALISAATLLGIYGLRGLSGVVGWGQASLHATFIIFISLFVNSIARLITQIRGANSPASKPKSDSSTAPSTTASKLAA